MIALANVRGSLIFRPRCEIAELQGVPAGEHHDGGPTAAWPLFPGAAG